MESGLREPKRIRSLPPLRVPRLRGNSRLCCPARPAAELRTGESVKSGMDIDVELEPTS